MDAIIAILLTEMTPRNVFLGPKFANLVARMQILHVAVVTL